MFLSGGGKKSERRLKMNNIFTVLINLLESVHVRGQADINTMGQVFSILHRMESAANEPEQPEVNDNG